jgi:hypothetical protein
MNSGDSADNKNADSHLAKYGENSHKKSLHYCSIGWRLRKIEKEPENGGASRRTRKRKHFSTAYLRLAGDVPLSSWRFLENCKDAPVAESEAPLEESSAGN